MSDQIDWSEITQSNGWDFMKNLDTNAVWARETGSGGEWVPAPSESESQGPPEPEIQVRRIGRREYYTDINDIEWTRRIAADGTRGEWSRVEAAVPEPAAHEIRNYLYLVRQKQPYPQPFHWLLSVNPEDGGRCTVYQVKGDAAAMHYTHATNIDIFNSTSFQDCYQLTMLDASGEAWVEYYANSEAPPSAVNQAAVRENCQDWTLRVLRALQSSNIVPPEKVNEVESLLDYQQDGRRNLG